MILLAPSPLQKGLYTMGAMDSPQNEDGADLWTNVHEACTFLWPFETEYAKAVEKLKAYGHVDFEQTTAEAVLKPIWQTLRHGLCIDWVCNYVLATVAERYPFSKHFAFKHTEAFIEKHSKYPVFATAISELHIKIDALLDWVFEGWPDAKVFARLKKWSETNNLADALAMLETKPVDTQFVIPTDPDLTRVRYLVLLMEMLQVGVGYVKRQGWTNLFEAIEGGLDEVIVMGGKYGVYAFGRLNGTLDWHKMPNGVKVLGWSGRTTRKGVQRSLPDEMTFFSFNNGTLWIDETHFPRISFDQQTWYAPSDIVALPISADTDAPMRMYVRYDLEGAAGSTIKIVGKQNCVIRDDRIVLDDKGCGDTQVVFRANEIAIKISDVDKKLPFGVFVTKTIRPSSTFAWLD